MQGGVSLSPVGFDDLSLSFSGRLCDRLCDGPSLGFVCSQEHGDNAHSQGLRIFSSFLFGSVGGLIGDVTDSLMFLFSPGRALPYRGCCLRTAKKLKQWDCRSGRPSRPNFCSGTDSILLISRKQHLSAVVFSVDSPHLACRSCVFFACKH